MRYAILGIVGALLFATPSSAQQAATPLDLMTRGEFKAAGLEKLSPTELAALNKWLDDFAVNLVKESVKRAPPAVVAGSVFPSQNPATIESRIEGDYEGWEGETIYRLQNGQIWQQSNYYYHYSYKYSPKVIIYKSGSIYKMKVDGDNHEPVTVIRLK